MVLAAIADDHGICWPSHEQLAAKCSLDARTVRRVLVLLQSRKLLGVEPGFRKDRSQTSNLYRLAFDRGGADNLSGGPDADDLRRGHRSAPGEGAGLRVTTNEPTIETSRPPPDLNRRIALCQRRGGW